MFARFEDALARAVASGRIAGGVALAADRDGVTYSHAAGARTVGAPAPMDLETVFWIASMTKAVASVAALQQVERGTVSLDGDLAGLVPEFGRLEVLETSADGTRSLRPARRGPTLRELLTHTSGLAYNFTSPALAEHLRARGGNPSDGSRANLLHPLVFDPGEGWIYGSGIDWAGLVVEAASGQRLDAYLTEHVFQPLGMVDTGFAVSDAQTARKAGVHVRGPDGALIQIPFGMPKDPEVLSGGAALYSTAPDYGRFLRMLLNGGALDGARVLSAETVRGLSDIHTGEHRAGAWISAQPNLSLDFDLHPGASAGHGLATMVAPAGLDDGRGEGALAWGGLANTYYWADPAAGKAGVLMTQLLPFGDPDVLALLKAFERDVYGVA